MILAFTNVQCDGLFGPKSISSNENKKEIIDRDLRVQLLDQSYDLDGKTELLLTNQSDKYRFELSKIGISYKTTFGKKAFTHDNVNVIIHPKDSKTITVSIPHGVTPQVAFALLENVKVVKH